MKRNLRVLAVLMRWDYGRPERGPSAEESFFLKPLRANCSEAEPFWFDEYMHDTDLLQAKLSERIATFTPQLIFFSTYTDQFRTDFLDSLKSKCTIVAWFGDDHWRFESYTRRYAGHFSTCVTTDRWAVPRYRAIGADVVASQWAADGATKIVAPRPPDADFLYDVSFVGIRNEVRAWYARQIERAGIRIECFGHGWPNGKLPYEKIAEVFNASRINVNFSNTVQQDIRFVLGGVRNAARWMLSKKRVEQIKARNFEIPLAGGFQLSHYAPGLEYYFDLKDELAIYISPEDCVERLRYYLANPQERYAMAVKAQKRAQAEHTFDHRLKEVLDYIYGKAAAHSAVGPT